MAKQTIDITTPYPGWTGDPNPTAFTKVNANFDELYDLTGSIGTIVEDVEQLKTEIEEKVDTALQDVDEKVAQAEQQLDEAIGQIPGQVDTAIAGRIPGKNRLINGDFRVWQRGTSFGAAVYTADRWYFNAGGVSSPNLSRNPIALGTAGLKAPAFAKVSYGAVTDATNHFVVFEQRIEGVQNFAGETATVSFNVFNAGAAGRQIAIEIQQAFGAGGSATVTGIGVAKYTLAAGLNTVTHTVAVPSVAGKTAGENNSLVLTLWATGGSAFNARNGALGAQIGDVHFTAVQMEVGGTATGLEWRPYATELALCQRYYEKSFDIDTAPVNNSTASPSIPIYHGVAFAGGLVHVHVDFKVTKRVKPAVAIFSSAANNSSSGLPSGYVGGAWTLSTEKNIDAAASGQDVFQMFYAVPGAAAPGSYLSSFQWTADAEL